MASVLIAATLLGGCSIERALRPDTYTVQRGDTLSGIAAHYGIDWHNLAQWNHVGPPYQLSVGQILYLKPFPPLSYARFNQGGDDDTMPAPQTGNPPMPSRQDLPSRSASTNTPYAPTRQPSFSQDNRENNRGSSSGGMPETQSPQSVATTATTRPRQSEQAPTPQDDQVGPTPDATSTSASSSSSQTSVPSSVSASSQPSSPSQNEAADRNTDTDTSGQTTNASHAAAATAAPVAKTGGPSQDGWQWPASGSLLQTFDPNDHHQGIEIGGQVGAPIYAASSGKVAYNGTGLKGYGQLIIIQHNDEYLSAYGFVKRSFVKQGQTVAAGAHIADMGLGPGNKPMLQFEIRKNGNPIDPEKLLPSR